MSILALDTSSDACSVALQTGDRIDERHVVEPRRHTHILIPMIEDLLRTNEIVLSDLDVIVLGNGPGSFIGMRIGASVAQGMAFAAGLQIVPVSSLAVIAAEVIAEHDAARVVVAQDARMGEVYLAEFRSDAEGNAVAVGEVRLHDTTAPLPLAPDTQAIAAGAGWQRYPDLLANNERLIAGLADCPYPRARFVLRAGVAAWNTGGAIAPDELVPAYVRLKVAETPRPKR